MKRLHLLGFVLCLVVFAIFVVSSSIKKSSVWYQNQNINSTVDKIGCSDKADRSILLTKAGQRSLRLLGEFESQCESQVTSQVLYFVDFVIEDKYVSGWVQKVSSDLKEFAEYQIDPIIVVRLPAGNQQTKLSQQTTTPTPTITSQQPSVQEKAALMQVVAKHTAWDRTLNELVRSGVKQEVVQNWIIFPEPNVPYQSDTALTPEEFGVYATAATQGIKTFYPKSKFGFVFNAMTFEQKGFSWGDQEYITWLPYLEKIDKSLISSLGVVAFPWLPAVGDSRPALVEVSEYIPEWIIAEAVNYTGVTDIWLVTGTFASLYAHDPAQQITVPAEIRKEWLDKTIKVVQQWEKKGWNSNIVLTTQDLRVDGSSSDWSYWGTQATNNQKHKWVVLEFLVALHEHSIPVALWL